MHEEFMRESKSEDGEGVGEIEEVLGRQHNEGDQYGREPVGRRKTWAGEFDPGRWIGRLTKSAFLACD